MKPGRKRKEIDIAEVERLAGIGLTDIQICYSLGVSDETLRRRKIESVEFVEAIKRGKAAALNIVSSKLMELCNEGNLGAIVWYDKTRARLTEAPTESTTRLVVEHHHQTHPAAGTAPDAAAGDEHAGALQGAGLWTTLGQDDAWHRNGDRHRPARR